MALHALGRQIVKCCPLQLLARGEKPAAFLVLGGETGQFVGHLHPFGEEGAGAGILATAGRILDRRAHVDDLADPAAALERDGEADAAPHDPAGEDVAPEAVGPEDVERRAVGRAEQVAVHPQAEEAVFPARREEGDGTRVGEIGAGDRLVGDGVELGALDDGEGHREEPPAGLDRRALGRGDVPRDLVGRREAHVPRLGVHRRREVGEHPPGAGGEVQRDAPDAVGTELGVHVLVAGQVAADRDEVQVLVVAHRVVGDGGAVRPQDAEGERDVARG